MNRGAILDRLTADRLIDAAERAQPVAAIVRRPPGAAETDSPAASAPGWGTAFREDREEVGLPVGVGVRGCLRGAGDGRLRRYPDPGNRRRVLPPKVSWLPFGTLWVRNVTPDTATGIGGWSDAQIARAIRAGVSRDGRALHWQGMTWDHASNWDEEDVRALVVYLRGLPWVRHAIPAPHPPAPDDCVVYSFWVKRSALPGCR